MMGLGSCDSQVADLVSEAQCLDSQASVLCILSWGFLSSYSLHWDSESRNVFLTTALCSSVTCFLQSFFFFFFFSCRCYKYFKTTNIEYDWRVVESVTWECAFLIQRLFLADFIFFFFGDRHRRNCKDRPEVTLLWGTFTLMKEVSICKGVFLPVPKEKDVSKSQKNLVNGKYLNLCNKPSHFNFSCFSY